MRIDWGKPYAETYGTHGRGYEQNGIEFNLRGERILRKAEEPKAPEKKPQEKVAPQVETLNKMRPEKREKTLDQMRRVELVKKARDVGAKFRMTMKSEQIIKEIEKAQNVESE